MSAFAILSALSSAFLMGIFYLLDLWFGEKKVYTRPTHTMIVSSIVPFVSSVGVLVGLAFIGELYLPTLWLGLAAFVSGVLMIWGNWNYFSILFPKGDRDVSPVDGATELTLYECATPVIVLVLWWLVSQFVASPDTISIGQVLAIIAVVGFLIGYGMVGGSLKDGIPWRYRLQLVAFAVMVSLSQLTQDYTLAELKRQLRYDNWQAFVALLPWAGFGMSSGIVVWWWKGKREDGTITREGTFFVEQWRAILHKYAWIIFVSEVIALASYAAVALAYSEEHVATSQAIAGAFPLFVFPTALWLQKQGVLGGDATEAVGRKTLWLFGTVLAVTAVVLL